MPHKIRPGSRNLQKSLIMVNLSEILVCGMQKECRLSELTSSLVSVTENMSWSKNFSKEVAVACSSRALASSQALSNWIKKSLLFYFFQRSCLLDLTVCHCAKSVCIRSFSGSYFPTFEQSLCIIYLAQPSKWRDELQSFL